MGTQGFVEGGGRGYRGHHHTPAPNAHHTSARDIACAVFVHFTSLHSMTPWATSHACLSLHTPHTHSTSPSPLRTLAIIPEPTPPLPSHLHQLPPPPPPTTTITRAHSYGRVCLDTHITLTSVPLASGAAPPLLHCAPLHINAVAHMLRPPPGGAPGADAFFRSWAALPARTELAAECVWPGRDGAACALSAMLSGPLACAMLRFIPASLTYIAALAGGWEGGEGFVLLLFLCARLARVHVCAVGAGGGGGAALGAMPFPFRPGAAARCGSGRWVAWCCLRPARREDSHHLCFKWAHLRSDPLQPLPLTTVLFF